MVFFFYCISNAFQQAKMAANQAAGHKLCPEQGHREELAARFSALLMRLPDHMHDVWIKRATAFGISRDDLTLDELGEDVAMEMSLKKAAKLCHMNYGTSMMIRSRLCIGHFQCGKELNKTDPTPLGNRVDRYKAKLQRITDATAKSVAELAVKVDKMRKDLSNFEKHENMYAKQTESFEWTAVDMGQKSEIWKSKGAHLQDGFVEEKEIFRHIHPPHGYDDTESLPEEAFAFEPSLAYDVRKASKFVARLQCMLHRMMAQTQALHECDQAEGCS